MEATASQAKSQNVVTFTTPFGTSRIVKETLLYGANASGKTNILRALDALCTEVRSESGTVGGESLGPLYSPFCLDDESSSRPASMDISFITNGMLYEYHVKYNQTEILEENLYYFPKGANRAGLYSRDTAYGEEMHGPSYPTTLSQAALRPRFGVYKNKLIISKFLYDTPHALIKPAAQYLADIGFANNYSSSMKAILWKDGQRLLYQEKYKMKLKKLIQYADLGIKDFTLPENHEYDKVSLVHNTREESRSNKISIEDESLGTQYLFLLGPKILFSLEKGTPLFIDEIESGFHPILTSFVLKMYQSERINPRHAQIVIVTHDVNLMQEDNLRRDQIWFTEKREDGSSELFSLSDFEGVREDTPFAKWYLANKFGAIPDLQRVETLFDV